MLARMSDFGDFDPEDAFDADDRSGDQLDVLHKVVVALEKVPADDARRPFRIVDALRLLATIHRHKAEVTHLRDRLEAL
jgi:hypothetical protein